MYWNEITGGNYLLNSASWLKTWFVVVALLWLSCGCGCGCGCCCAVIVFVITLSSSLLCCRCVVAIVTSSLCHVVLSLSPHHHRCRCVIVIVALSHCRHCCGVIAITSLPCRVVSLSLSLSRGAHGGAGPRAG